jgi:hypothetical protein
VVRPPYRSADFKAEDFPGKPQTIVAGVNDKGVTVGYYSSSNRADANLNPFLGFYRLNGKYHKVVYPTRHNSVPPDNELTGIKDAGIAVGYYVDSSGHDKPYRYNTFSHQFSIPIQGASSVVAAGISNNGAIVGYVNWPTGKIT